ncbi:excinuclease ATPase subunit [Agarivorans sp. QJM3NY_33]|uniref:excinuclease ATPase subunit n=1 Tax=Agarivorans sp. QJM3NY_33 TaxID=3421432 RepID=UPI003D7DB75A
MLSVKKLVIFSLVALSSLSFSAMARNELLTFKIADAMETGKQKNVLDDSIALYFNEQTHDAVQKTFGEYTSNKKTNAFGKSDLKACNWAFLSAIKSLQQRAAKEGGNAVINIHSYYKKNTFSSDSEFQCGAGAIMAGVALVGEVVKL